MSKKYLESDFIVNYSPGKKAQLYYSHQPQRNIFFIKTIRNFLKKIYLSFMLNPNDEEINRALTIINKRKEKTYIDKVKSFLSEKFRDDHLRKFEYPFLAQSLFKIGLENKVLVDIGGGFSYSTIIPVLLTLTHLKVVSVDCIDYPRKSKYPIYYLTGNCMNAKLASSYADIVTLISTLEHVGLGRYGDPFDVHGDINAMREARRILKRGGYAILSVPYGYPTVVYNLHRVYDAGRFKLLTQGFKQILLKYSFLGNPCQRKDIEGKHVVKDIAGFYQNVPEDQRIYNPQGGIMALLRKI